MKKAAVIMCAAISVGAAPLPTSLKLKALKALPEVRESFDNQLLDYTTARFKEVNAGYTKIGDAPYFCGQVNAKNSNGAYIGWRWFSWQSWATKPLLIEGADGEGLERIASQCADEPDTRDPTDYSAAITYKAR